ncbi:amino acid adenylation domain-containing protein, partial [Microbulbifer sp. 2304DJ12-6]|uniref:amino acid adenylation domain-containing protein n=1 Tax=Microbulbifer sp. 2304DJ12-6 TaxID=3233340 RepID=UPI0039AF20BF
MSSRSIDLLVGMTGIFKAGAVYVPMDSSHPDSRLSYMIEDSGIKVVVSDAEHFVRANGYPAIALSLDNAMMLATQSVNGPAININGESPAYVIYTSGSTGQPKGVEVSHGALLNLSSNISRWPTSDKGWGLTVACGFDASLQGICQLLAGRPLTIIDDAQKMDGAALAAVLELADIGVMDCTPGLVDMWFSEGLATVLPDLIIGGEAISSQLWQQLVQWQQKNGRTALNVYGPTECCVDSTWCVIDGDEPHIGVAVDGASCHVLDMGAQPVAPGTPGELYIGGAGLAFGYVGKPGLTADAFIDNPFGKGQLYRTADRVLQSENGKLYFLGRTDDQIKLRGYRIELGEIVNQINKLEGVASSHVIVIGEQLVAYAIAEPEVVGTLSEQLEKRLPEYMVPATFVAIEEWPLTANGKIDRKALPIPDALSQQNEYIAPAGATEQRLAGLWADLLEVPADELSVTANFFTIGGHSLLATRLAARIRDAFEVDFSVRAVFEHPTIRKLVGVLNQADVSARPPLVAQPRDGDIPLSFAQQRLWFIEQLQGASSLYNMPFATRIIGPLDSDVVAQALEAIFQRHEVLRTTYESVNDEPVQHIHTDMALPLICEDLRGMADSSHHIQKAVNDEASAPFDLSSDAMLRGRLLHSGDEEHVLLLTMHHIASDGVSMGVLMNEFGQLIAGLSTGVDVVQILEPLSIQYADYALWQRGWLQGEALERQCSYWMEQLSGLPTTHSLRLDRSRPARMSHRGDHVDFWLETDALDALKLLAAEQDVTLFMLLHGAFALLVARHSNEQDIVVGTPVASRPHIALESLVGFFVNTLVLRVDVDPTLKLGDFLAQIKAVNLAAQEHQDIPFEFLVEQLNPERSQQHTPLFQIMLNFLQVGDGSRARDAGLTFESLSSDEEVAKFELSLTLTEAGPVDQRRLRCSFNYATDLFDRSTIEQLAERFGVLLATLSKNRDALIGNLPILTESDTAMAMRHSQPVPAGYPTDMQLQEIVEQRAVQMPDQTALVCSERSVSYRTLNETANRLAHYLRLCGVGSGDPVWLCMDRSIESVTSQLAILKAGGAYVPLDPDYPAKRLNMLMDSHKFDCLLGLSEALARLSIEPQVARTITVDALDVVDAIAAQPATNLNRLAGQGPDSLAYMMFTSGSSGQPKGVMTPHIGVIRLLADPNFIELDSNTRSLHFAAHAFDASTLEIWGPILNGGCCVIYPYKRIDIDELNQVIRRDSVTSVFFTSGLFDKWSEQRYDVDSLRWVMTGGDVVSPLAVQRVYRHYPNVTVISAYGPTENTIYTTCCKVPSEHRLNTVPIGLPVTGTSAFVLSPTGSLVPPGCVGELYTGGDGLALGYHNQPDMTAEVFVDTPFGEGKLYRTGDLVWQADDGQLMFAGRKDTQVKVRGFRVEPGEIMHQLNGIDGVVSSLVQVIGDSAADKQLVAWVVVEKDNPPTREVLRTELAARVPEHMVPGFFLLLDDWPLTAVGKIDRRALPTPDALSQQDEYIAPADEIEKRLAGLWADLLEVPVDELSVTANFFVIGGHSLLATRLAARIRDAFEVDFSVRAVFEHPTIHQLVGVLNQADASARPPLVEQPRDGDIPLSFAQQRLWFIEQLQGASGLYNMPFATRIIGPLDSDVVVQALEAIFQRHEVLRTTYESVNDEPVQRIHTDMALPLIREDLRGMADSSHHIQEA